MAFSPDGSLMAIRHSYTELRLIDPATGRQLAALEAPEGFALNLWFGFSPDASLLVCACLGPLGDDVNHVWDLQLIRQQLAERGLDWGLPGYPGFRPDDRQPLPVMILHPDPKEERGLALEKYKRDAARIQKEIEELTQRLASRPQDAQFYARRGQMYAALKDYIRAVSDMATALRIEPEQAQACNALAWIYVVGPQELRAPDKALPLAQRAVRLAPIDWKLRNTLGVVYYRLGQFDASIETLERSIEDSKQEATAYDLFFLAMNYQQIGQATRARSYYDRAVRWMQAQGAFTPDEEEELNAFCSEANAVLSKQAKP
jgi:tetratricopeptide (TPR) repeat protein